MRKRNQKLPQVVTRRQFCTLMGFGALYYTAFDPINVLARSLVDGLISDAQAQSAPRAKNFVSILYPGAPTRWVWDGFLNPNNETIVRNGSVNNWLLTDAYDVANTANVGYRAELVTLSDGRTIYLPPLWNRNIPTSGSGGPVAMKALLENAMIIRGVNMQIDLGHGVGPAKVLFPLGASASLTGLVGDASSSPLPVVGTSGGGRNYADPVNRGYKSLKGTTSTLVRSSSDPLTATLSSFIQADPNALANSDILNSAAVQSAIKSSLGQLGSYAKKSLPGSDVLYNNADNAAKLFQTAFGDLKMVYTNLANKYTALAQACARTAIPNIIPATGTGTYNLATGIFTNEFASQFAIAEYLLTSGYSSTISMSSGAGARVASLSSSNDEHREDDRQQSMICHSYQFLSLSAMIYELRRVLIAKGIWNQTVVHVSAEYNRSPQDDGMGTDHAPNSNIITMFSGAITKPTFIGNIKTDATPTTNYRGTYGVSAPVKTERGDLVITNNVAASTTAALLGVENPLTQSSSIIAVDASGVGITSLAEAPKNV